MRMISVNLWFDSQAEEAAEFYTTVFDNSEIKSEARYSEAGRRTHGQEPGTAMTVDLELDGCSSAALDHQFDFSEVTSSIINCGDQAEVDYHRSKLSAVGESAQCGRPKDKFGVSRQVVPTVLYDLPSDPDQGRRDWAMNPMLWTKKLDIGGLAQLRQFSGEIGLNGPIWRVLKG